MPHGCEVDARMLYRPSASVTTFGESLCSNTAIVAPATGASPFRTTPNTVNVGPPVADVGLVNGPVSGCELALGPVINDCDPPHAVRQRTIETQKTRLMRSTLS